MTNELLSSSLRACMLALLAGGGIGKEEMGTILGEILAERRQAGDLVSAKVVSDALAVLEGRVSGEDMRKFFSAEV